MARQTFRFLREPPVNNIIINLVGSSTDDVFDPRLLDDPAVATFLGSVQLSPTQLSLSIQRVSAGTHASLSSAWRGDGTLLLSNPVAGDLLLDYTATRTSSPYRFPFNEDNAGAAWFGRYRAGNDQTLDITFDDGVPTAATVELSVGTPYAYPVIHPVGGELALGRAHAYAHAEFVQTDMAVGRPNAQVKRATLPIIQEQAVGQPNGQRLTFAAPFPAEFTFDFGARNRTRSNGSIWEWNDDDLLLAAPFGAGARVLDRLRVAADRIQFTDAANDDPGFSDRFKADGILHLTSPAAGTVSIAEHTIASNGRLNPTSHPDWSTWWTAFSADASNTLSIRFEIPGPAMEMAVGQPNGVKDRTRYGAGLAITQDMAVGQARGFFPKLRAQPIAMEAATGRPHGFAHAEFILLEQDVGRPLVKQFAVPGTVFPKDAVSERDWGSPTHTNSYNASWDFYPGSNDYDVFNIAINLTGSSSIEVGHQIGGLVWLLPAPTMQFAVGMIFTLSADHGDITLRHRPAPFDSGRENFSFREDTPGLVEWLDAFWDDEGNPSSEVEFRLQFEIFQPFLAQEPDVGRPNAQVKRAVQPITLDNVVGRPNALVKRAVLPLSLEQAVGMADGRTQIIGDPIALVQEQAVGRPQPYGHGAGVAIEQAVGRPRGYITKVAAHAIAIEQALSRPHGFAHAEFVQTDMAVGRPRAQVKRAVQPLTQEQALGRPAAILFGEPGSTTAGTTTTESHNFGRYTLIRNDANSTWQFDANLTLPEPIMTSTAAPIAQAHVRANQVRFIRTGGQNPGFSDAFNTSGRLTLARVGGSSFMIVGPNFDHLGRMDPSGLDGYSEWWTAFSGGGTLSQLEVTWELDSAGFVPFLAQEQAVGRPEGRTRLQGETLPIAQELAVGKPHGFAHAEFILLEQDVGRPRVSTTRAVRPIVQEQAVGRAHAFAHAEFVQTDMAVGRPGVSTTRAVRPITQHLFVERPDGLKQRVAVGMPITLFHSVGRPRGFFPKLAAQPITAEAAVGRPGALVKRAVRPIAQEQAVGQPQPYAHGAGVIQEQAVGRPRGFFLKLAARPIAAELSTGRPHGFAHAEFILLEQAVGRPRGQTTRGVFAIAQELGVGRPHTLRAIEGIGLEQAVGRPRGFFPKLAARPVTLETATGRPSGVTQARLRPVAIEQAVARPNAQVKRAVLPIVAEQAVGRPHVLTHALAIAVEQAVGRPAAFVKRAVRSIAAEQAVSMPSGVRRRIGYGQPITTDQAVGRPNAEVKRAVLPIVAEQVTARPAAVLFASGRPLVQDVVLGRPNGRILRVGTMPIAAGLSLSLPHGERLHAARGIPAVLGYAVGRPAYYRQAFGTGIVFELVLGTPRGFFPRRNPLREAQADVQARDGDFSVAANEAQWQATAR